MRLSWGEVGVRALSVVIGGTITLVTAGLGLSYGANLLDGYRLGWCEAADRRLGGLGGSCTAPFIDAQTRVVTVSGVIAAVLILLLTIVAVGWRRLRLARLRRGHGAAGAWVAMYLAAARGYVAFCWLFIGVVMGNPAPETAAGLPLLGESGNLGPWWLAAVWFVLPSYGVAGLHAALGRRLAVKDSEVADIRQVLANGGGWCVVRGAAADPVTRSPVLERPCLAWRLEETSVSHRSWSETVRADDAVGPNLGPPRSTWVESDGTEVTRTVWQYKTGYGQWTVDYQEVSKRKERSAASHESFTVLTDGVPVRIDPADIDLQLASTWTGDGEAPEAGYLRKKARALRPNVDLSTAELFLLAPGEQVTLYGEIREVDGTVQLMSPKQARSHGFPSAPGVRKASLRSENVLDV